MRAATARTSVLHYDGTGFTERPDTVAGEEPLEVRLDGSVLTITMRTPGADVDLVHGFLHAEGVIAEPTDVLAARYCDGRDADGRQTYNVMDVTAGRPLEAAARAEINRLRTTTSACGVCGKASIDDLRQRSRHPAGPGPGLPAATLAALPDQLREGQRAFAATGGLHAAAVAGPDGRLRHLREDVGRHNAVDKVIGAALRAGELPLSDVALVTSSRASFELVQKALLAGIGMLIAVSAPSSLAVEVAAETGLTLIGFTRGGRFNLYTHPERVVGP